MTREESERSRNIDIEWHIQKKTLCYEVKSIIALNRDENGLKAYMDHTVEVPISSQSRRTVVAKRMRSA